MSRAEAASSAESSKNEKPAEERTEVGPAEEIDVFELLDKIATSMCDLGGKTSHSEAEQLHGQLTQVHFLVKTGLMSLRRRVDELEEKYEPSEDMDKSLPN